MVVRLVVLAAAVAFAIAVAGAVLVDAEVAPRPPARSPVEGVKIAAAGDIACDPESSSFAGGLGSGNLCRQTATSDLMVGAGYRAVLALGDIQYEDASIEEFLASYDPSWGRVKEITRPVPGNHEYRTPGAAGYYGYFGAAAGDPAEGYYSFDLGTWHLVALNSNCAAVGGCHEGSPQETWLREDLAENSRRCTLAYWHHPRYSSGSHGSDPAYSAFFQTLYETGADVVLVAHDHGYERFAPQDANGRRDLERGIPQFVVGTGGRSLRTFPSIEPNSEVRDRSTFGVLELTLGVGAYAWRFRAAVGSFTDSGSATCN